MGDIKYCGKEGCGHAHSDSFDGEGNAIAKECARCNCKKFEATRKSK